MKKNLLIATCLIQALGLSAMEVDTYKVIGNGPACTAEENKQLHNLFVNAGTLTREELERQYTNLKNNDGIDLTKVQSLSTRNLVLHELVLHHGSLENATFLIEAAGLHKGLMIAGLTNRNRKTTLDLAQEQEPVNEELVQFLLAQSKGARKFIALSNGVSYIIFVGLLFGGYKLYSYCTTDKTAKS